MSLFRQQIKAYRSAYYSKYGKLPKLPRTNMAWLYPHSQERKLFRYIRDYVASFSKLYSNFARENYTRFRKEVHGDLKLDAYYEEMDEFNEELLALQAAIPEYQKGNMLAALIAIGEATDSFNKEQFDKFARQAMDTKLIPDTALTTEAVEAWASLNHTLITSLPKEYINKANTIVMEGVQQGRLWKDVQYDLQKLDKSLSKNRAKLIARDQIGKLNGTLTQQRMEGAELRLYTWSTSLDERVRGNPSGRYPNAKPSHWVMEGKLCRWDDSTVWSIDGGETWVNRPMNAPMVHPGIEIQCRCSAIPYWEELIGEIDAEILNQTI